MRTGDDPSASSDQMGRVLIESRRRWRDFGTLAADIAFEVDADGNISFLAPDSVLGRESEGLIGLSAADVFFGAAFEGADPFLSSATMRQRRVWLRQAGGDERCFALSSSIIHDELGNRTGVRGVAVDVTAQESRDINAAAALRRAEVLDYILEQIRHEVLAPKIMASLLGSVILALGTEGAAVLDIAQTAEISTVLHSEGAGLQAIQHALHAALSEDNGPPQEFSLEGGTNVIACQASTRFGHQAVLVAWRKPGSRKWDADERQLVGAITALVRIVLEHEAIERELARQARTDPLTGLLNRRAFIEEAGRRIDRLEREGSPGTLMFVDLDRLKLLNDQLGHEVGDNALILASDVLRRIVRPADLVARLGGDEFALWLDGFDELTAAERAEHLRLTFPHDSAHLTEGHEFQLTMSIGIACRQPGGGEELEDIIARADQAMYEVKRNGRGHWRVSHPERVR